MPKYTAFLELALPEFNEFRNSWHTVVNQNMEDVDDFCKDLHAALVGTGSSSMWTDLIGSMDSLAERLAVSLEDDGTIDITGTPGIMDMATSAVKGGFTTPSGRLNDGDFEIFDSRQPMVGARFTPIPTAGPSAAFPPAAGIDPGIAFRAADFSARTGRPHASPPTPFAPGLVMGGANPLITGLGVGQVRITADAPAAVFNIDGYVFRLREILDLDWTLLAPANNAYVWIFVDRNEGTYNNANFKYSAPSGGAFATKDLRKLQSGTGTGTTSGSTFTATGTLFNTAAFGKVKEGDTLVITSGAAQGRYVVNALDGTTPDTKLTVRGTMPTSANINWYIEDKACPNVGAVVTDTTTTTLPPFVAGRVYIARAQHQTGGAPINIVTFAAGGVHDSGWTTVDASADFPLTVTHNLGVVPSQIEIWCRASASAAEIYEPYVQRTVVTDVDTSNTSLDPGDITTAVLLFRSLVARSSELATVVRLQNATTTPSKPAALFTDSGGTDVTVGQIRVIARR